MAQKKIDELSKAYEPKQVEERIYSFWSSKDLFKPLIDESKKPFTIIMPPPNVTGELHLGHALTVTLEDIMVRWHRMLGDPTLWLPGIDHAGIATQVVVERDLASNNIDRKEIGREEFVAKVWEWVGKYGDIIMDQNKRLGASCDWSRQCFTLDPKPSHAVQTTFVNLYKKNLIYRGERIINWCPSCSTALSDLEVEHKETQGHLYYIDYKLVDSNESLSVATTRPETMFGDTAVAVNPEDPRYKDFIGKHVELPLIRRQIPVISDAGVDQDFGTGALKITPGHSPVDFDIGAAHSLPVINIFNLDGTFNNEAGPYEGQNPSESRQKIAQDLDSKNLLSKVEPYSHSVGHCQRCRDPVEPIVSKQWFVKMKPLAKPAIDSVNKGEIKIIPERFSKIYLNWLENIKDWCVSRQLWWGHRIPVWTCQNCSTLIVQDSSPTRCDNCASSNLEQDPDVLDTWFSSALWTHSTMGWPEQTKDFSYFYPTSVMETGYDILFFWVARMIMLGIENTGKVPFKTVYLHGLIRDIEGQKMSKTRGNVLDPVKAIDTYGCDALRFAITTGTTPGNDQRLGTNKLEAGRNFANKLWNASRFVLSRIDKTPSSQDSSQAREITHIEDRWIINQLSETINRVNLHMERFEFGDAERTIHDFFWNEYCDWYIEMCKVRMSSNDGSPMPTLISVLDQSLRLLHPFMPFITEEIWLNLKKYLPDQEILPESISICKYPKSSNQDPESKESMSTILEIVRAIRNIKSEFRIEQKRDIEITIVPKAFATIIERESRTIEELANIDSATITPNESSIDLSSFKGITVVLKNATILVSLNDLINLEDELRRLNDELEESIKIIRRLEDHMGNEEFTGKAPIDVVDRERARLELSQDRKKTIVEFISQLSAN